METINFRMKEKEAEWKETRRQIKNDLAYEEKQAQRKCAADIEQAQRKCAADIEQAQRKYHERIKAVAIEEDTYKAAATEAKNARRAQVLAELERIDALAAKHNISLEGGEQ